MDVNVAICRSGGILHSHSGFRARQTRGSGLGVQLVIMLQVGFDGITLYGVRGVRETGWIVEIGEKVRVDEQSRADAHKYRCRNIP